MLPTSHSTLIVNDALECAVFNESAVSDAPSAGLTSRSVLASAFSEFIEASSRLEQSYGLLQEEVKFLRQELRLRNLDLEQSRRQNERMRLDFERILETMPSGIAVGEGNGLLAFINPEGRRLLGIENDGVLPETLEELSSRCGIQLQMPETTDADVLQEVHTTAAGEDRWIEIRSRALENEDAGTRGIFILRDVTQRKLAEDTREQGRHAMAMAEVSTDIAHEIRNPLASLEFFAGLVESDSEGRDRWICHLRAGIRWLSTIVNNVLLVRSGNLPLTAINLPEALESSLTFARPLLEQAEIELLLDCAVTDFTIQGNSSAIQQVILNLVLNAVRHTPAGGTLTVTVKKTGAERCEVQFLDSGEGIAPEILERVMEAGFSGKGQSSGRGLAVCRQMMREHGGSIWVGNGPVRGAWVVLSFQGREVAA